MYDVTIFSDLWPKGLLASKLLAEQGSKVCYVQLIPQNQNPFGILLNEYDQEQKYFLEEAGQLLKQKEGICVISPEKTYSFQETSHFNNSFNPEDGFSTNWLNFLSKGLMSQIYENNDDDFTEGLDFSSDYFLFKDSEFKRKEFRNKYKDITYLKLKSNDIQYFKKQKTFAVSGQQIASKKFIWLAKPEILYEAFGIKKTRHPEWRWECMTLESDNNNYNYIAPLHFISLKHLSLPWSYDNLLSVFHFENYWDVWFKRPCHKEKKEMTNSILSHLNNIFQSRISFKVIQEHKTSSFYIYGKDKLKDKVKLPKEIVHLDIANNMQADLSSCLKFEKELVGA